MRLIVVQLLALLIIPLMFEVAVNSILDEEVMEVPPGIQGKCPGQSGYSQYNQVTVMKSIRHWLVVVPIFNSILLTARDNHLACGSAIYHAPGYVAVSITIQIWNFTILTVC
ncbi:uncharacterized protein LOC113556997 [Rhopalosiphum maidis]|uniref:uncharacterized protein LOC113556997 n=1 Tax=Rhopalosiphum maidis TaxID=43146 RepID=UPI000F008832|nr:uncharacterized protein LOC113556997 [Rhopalosiphum maidis]